MRHYCLAFLLYITFQMALCCAQAESQECTDIEVRIRELLQNKSCKSSRECGAIQLPAPFDCNIAVNKNVLGELENLRRDYTDFCKAKLFNCKAHTRSIWCKKGRCVARVELDRRYPSITTQDQYGRQR